MSNVNVVGCQNGVNGVSGDMVNCCESGDCGESDKNGGNDRSGRSSGSCEWEQGGEKSDQRKR